MPRPCNTAIRFPPANIKKIAAELVRLTGLKPQVIEDNNLRIDPGVFRKQLLHDEGYHSWRLRCAHQGARR